MSKWIGTTLVIASIFVVSGCNNGDMQQDEPTGGPGADVRSDQDQEPQQEEQTFTPSLEEESLEVPAGQEKEMTLSIDRGDQFDQTVTVQVTPPEGLTADPEQLELESGQTEGKITLKAGADAPVGEEMSIEIQFQPESGDSVTKQLTVTVTEQQQSDSSSEASSDNPEESDQESDQ